MLPWALQVDQHGNDDDNNDDKDTGTEGRDVFQMAGARSRKRVLGVVGERLAARQDALHAVEEDWHGEQRLARHGLLEVAVLERARLARDCPESAHAHARAMHAGAPRCNVLLVGADCPAPFAQTKRPPPAATQAAARAGACERATACARALPSA